MNPFTMAELLLGDMKLTPGQLAQLRAINTRYFTELYALQRKVGAGSATDGRSVVPEADLAALDATIARDIRDMLSEDQRAVLDRNWPRLRERAVERPVTDERVASASTPAPASRVPAPSSSAAPGRSPDPGTADAPSEEG
jgi:hypothetical protein